MAMPLFHSVKKECPSFAERGFNSSTCFQFGAKLDREKHIWRTIGFLRLFRKLIAEWQKSLEYNNFCWRNVPFKQIVGPLYFNIFENLHYALWLDPCKQGLNQKFLTTIAMVEKKQCRGEWNWSTSCCQHVSKIIYKEHLINSFN